jgi:hypothetical protein
MLAVAQPGTAVLSFDLCCDAGSACRDWPTLLAAPLTASLTGDQRTPAKSRQRPNPHSV